MSKQTLERSVLRQLGEPKAVARDMLRFRRAARALSSNHPRYIEAYPKQWVVIHDGKVIARGQTMESALLQAKQKHLPVENLIVRYIDKNDRTFIF